MAKRVKFIDQKAVAAYGSQVILNTNGVDDPNFVVDRVVLRIAAAYSAYTSGSFGIDDFGLGTILSRWRKTSQTMINNATWRALDYAQKRQRKPAAFAADVFATLTPSGAGTFNFDMPIPMKRREGKKPEDFCVPLAEIGSFQVQAPTTDPITGTFTTMTFTLIAIGHDAKPGTYVAGAHWRFDELTGETGLNVNLDAGGNKLWDLFDYSAAPGSSPISGNTDPRVQLDGREIVNFRGFNCADTPWLWGRLLSADDYADFYTASGVTNTSVGDLVPASIAQKISDCPQVSQVQLNFGARLATPGDDRFCMTTLYPSQSEAILAQRVPGASGVSVETMAQIKQVKGATGGKATSDSPFLPATVTV